MFTITIESLLRFHEYFDDKMISTKNLPLGFGKVQSTHLSCGFFAQNNVERFGREKIAQNFNILCHLKSCHVASMCLVRSRSPCSKNVIGIAQMDRVSLSSSKT